MPYFYIIPTGRMTSPIGIRPKSSTRTSSLLDSRAYDREPIVTFRPVLFRRRVEAEVEAGEGNAWRREEEDRGA